MGAATHASTRVRRRERARGLRALAGGDRGARAPTQPRPWTALMSEYPVAYPISVGKVVAGDWASTVPDLLVAEGRLGVCLDEDPATHAPRSRRPWPTPRPGVAWLRRAPAERPVDRRPVRQWAPGRRSSPAGAAGGVGRRRRPAAHPGAPRGSLRQRPAPVRARRDPDPPLRPGRCPGRPLAARAGADRRDRHGRPGADPRADPGVRRFDAHGASPGWPAARRAPPARPRPGRHASPARRRAPGRRTRWSEAGRPRRSPW